MHLTVGRGAAMAAMLGLLALASCSSSSDGGGTVEHSISGNAGIAFATVSLTGAATATTTADASGSYSFAGLADGSYTVTPSTTDRSFTPTSRAVTVSGADVTGVDFVASLSLRIAGIVRTAGGAAVAGVTVSLGGAKTATATTDALGSYAFNALGAGWHSVTPSKAGYAFTPSSLGIQLTLSSVINADFTAAAVYRISGVVKDAAGAPAPGVTVSLTGQATRTATTDTAGSYAFADLVGGSYTVAPAKTAYTFTPASRSVTLTGDLAGQDFTMGSSNWDFLVWDYGDWN